MLLEVSGLTTAYAGLVAISEINVAVAEHEIVVVAGANGAGKSTLLQSIAGLVRPSAGRVLLAGQAIQTLPPHRIAGEGLAFVPENKRLFPRLSVADNLRLGSYLHRGKADRDEPLDRVYTLFPRLKERLSQRAETLSGGEQQMLAIGRALMTRPRLLMLDEPSQGISPKLVDAIFDAVLAIRKAGVTVLLVEQRLVESLQIADRAYVLQTGRVSIEGSAADVRDDPEVRRAYLGI